MTRNYSEFKKAVDSIGKNQVRLAYYYSQLTDEEKKTAREYMKEQGIEKSLISRLLSCGALLRELEGTKTLYCIYPVPLNFGMLKELAGKDEETLTAFFDKYGEVKGISEFREKWKAFTAPEEVVEDSTPVDEDQTNSTPVDEDQTNSTPVDEDQTNSTPVDNRTLVIEWCGKWNVPIEARKELLALLGIEC